MEEQPDLVDLTPSGKSFAGSMSHLESRHRCTGTSGLLASRPGRHSDKSNESLYVLEIVGGTQSSQSAGRSG